jgi:kynurenine 3-monooxygenase
MSQSVAVVGAGLVGALMALGLGHRGYNVTLLDLRPDPRTTNDNERKNLRSINLAVSDRGIRGLEYVDPEMATRVLKDIIPMYGRMIHTLDGKQESQIYGLFGEHINSIDRAKLNENLLDEIDKFNQTATNQIKLLFNHKITNLNFTSRDAKVECVINNDNGIKEKKNYNFDFIVGADGSYSNIRYQMQKYIRMDYSQEYIDKCYLELYIPPGENNSFLIDPNHLHIWPRKDFMLIALANGDGSFTSTFFGPWKLTESLNKPEIIKQFFEFNFPDAIKLIGVENIIKVFMENPKGALMQVTCSQYNYSDKCIIIGDASHSMVPFYGQGMNCGFEDVRTLLQLLDLKDITREEAFNKYSQTRHEDLKAILKLALDNYKEMSTKVISSAYLFRKTLDGLLGKAIPSLWVPLYTMVSFRGDIPYGQCIKREERQQRILKGIEASILIGACFVGAWWKCKR